MVTKFCTGTSGVGKDGAGRETGLEGGRVLGLDGFCDGVELVTDAGEVIGSTVVGWFGEKVSGWTDIGKVLGGVGLVKAGEVAGCAFSTSLSLLSEEDDFFRRLCTFFPKGANLKVAVASNNCFAVTSGLATSATSLILILGA